MTDTTLPPAGGEGDRIEPVDLGQEMQKSYIDYAMSVIVGRALPRGARRPEAGASPTPVCILRRRFPTRPQLREVGETRCGDDG